VTKLQQSELQIHFFLDFSPEFMKKEISFFTISTNQFLLSKYFSSISNFFREKYAPFRNFPIII